MKETNYLCRKCQEQLIQLNLKGKEKGFKITFLYEYSAFFREILFRYKGCGDLELAPIFLDYYANYIQYRFRNWLFILAPSSKERISARGFSHLEEILKPYHLNTFSGITKKQDFKQSDLSLEARQNILSKLEIIDGSKLSGKNAMIFDDVYTTGATIRAMIDLILPYQPRKIQVLVLAKVFKIDEE
ncbi:MAG: hypothetical protein LBR37_03745 [Erysipelotrichaceae bacterium]|jgi:predicted amidophosphoribosyltransferase|nr:hypothetical protein [Erysipelotrichaceae bacterium]